MNNIFVEFASPLLLIVKGLMVGIIASAPMGPVGILCIQRTIQKGRAYGIVTGAGAALSDIIYALITGLGMSFVMDFIDNEQNIFWMKLAGSIMLFILEFTCFAQTLANVYILRQIIVAHCFTISPQHS